MPTFIELGRRPPARVSAAVLLVAALLSGVAQAQVTPAASPKADAIPASGTFIPASDARIGHMGRLAMQPDGAHMSFPGIVIRFVYRGAAPTLRLNASSPNCFFNLACNGWDPVVIRLRPGENEIHLPAGAAPASGWLVELVRRTEGWQGLTVFEGLSLPPGCELLPPPPWPQRKLMFIGDSITCGDYVELIMPDADSRLGSSNAARSFGMLLGRWLNAQVHLVSCGGRGVVRDSHGRTDVANAPQFFKRALPDDPASSWNPADYTPDAIVVCLGNNDFVTGMLDEARYTQAYDDFVGEVRGAHPHAVLLLAETPTFGGDTPGTDGRAKRELLRRVLDSVVKRRQAEGDSRIAVAPVSFFGGTAFDKHPVAFQHEQIALELLGPIRSLTGW